MLVVSSHLPAMDSQQLHEVELLAQTAYTCVNNEERRQAEERLAVFHQSDSLLQCQYILDHSSNPYALHLATKTITTLMTNHWQQFSDRAVDVVTHLLNSVSTRGLKVDPFVMQAQIILLCRVVKLGWKEIPQFQKLPEHLSELARTSPAHFCFTLEAFTQLVAEMNKCTANHTTSQQRKIAVHFRDNALSSIFELALSALNEIVTGGMQTSDSMTREKLKELAIGLALNCLSFDFLGIETDDSAEDVSIVHVPTSWRVFIEDGSIINLFFELYANCKPPLSGQAMACLVQLISIRRSLFSSREQQDKILYIFMNNMIKVLRNATGLDDLHSHHQFCRLLARLKANVQLTQIVSADCYNEWIDLISDFTIKSFGFWQWGMNNTFYLLSAWQRLLCARSYLKGNKPSMLEKYAPRIVQAYITARIESVHAVLQDPSIENMMENEEQLQSQLSVLPQLGRCDYQSTSEFLKNMFDPLATSYKEFVEGQKPVTNDLQVVEYQLAWLVYMIGAIVGGRFLSSAEEYDQIDGELSSHVLQLMTIHDNRIQHIPTTKGTELLELAFLRFFHEFRRVYIGDHAMSSSKVYDRMGELIGIKDSLSVLSLIIRKIGTNLKCWAHSENVVSKTLDLFDNIAHGYSTNKLLRKLQVTHQILSHHTVRILG